MKSYLWEMDRLLHFAVLGTLLEVSLSDGSDSLRSRSSL